MEHALQMKESCTPLLQCSQHFPMICVHCTMPCDYVWPGPYIHLSYIIYMQCIYVFGGQGITKYMVIYGKCVYIYNIYSSVKPACVSCTCIMPYVVCTLHIVLFARLSINWWQTKTTPALQFVKSCSPSRAAICQELQSVKSCSLSRAAVR